MEIGTSILLIEVMAMTFVAGISVGMAIIAIQDAAIAQKARERRSKDRWIS